MGKNIKKRTVPKLLALEPRSIIWWSSGLLVAYTFLYVVFGITFKLGFVITPPYLSFNFILISLPLYAFSVGVAFGMLAGYHGRLKSAIGLSMVLGAFIYLVSAFIFYIIDGAMTYLYYL